MSYKKSQAHVRNPLKLSVVLDRVKDPGNMGTIIRTAAAIGCQSVLTTSESANPWSPKVLRSAMGAHFHVRIQDKVSRDELKQFVRTKQLVFADSKCERVAINYANLSKHLNPSDHVCLVVGNETKGVSDEMYDALNENGDAKRVVVRVPLEKSIESLNCSVAFAVIAFEIRRILRGS